MEVGQGMACGSCTVIVGQDAREMAGCMESCRLERLERNGNWAGTFPI